MNWLKKGMFFRPSGKGDALTHGFVPTAELIDQNLLRIYFSTRDKNLVSRIRYIDVDPKNMEIIYTSPEPILNTGEFSCFDEDGVVPSSIINVGDEKYLYYFGWQKTFSNGYMLLCGLAISRDNGKTFKRFSKTPLLERSDREPFQRSTVSVLRDNNIFRMWYSSGVSWTEFNGKPCPKYLIRYAESTDGIKWNHTDKICIDFLDDDEFGIARPWVINEDGIYKMWYSIRRKSIPYRLGYAISKNGLDWERRDQDVGITVSDKGWDSQMICFNSVVKIEKEYHMFYNGNKHGVDGFGRAILH